MKGIARNFENNDQNSSLHMKENLLILKIEKYFNFLKMDKKNVQKIKAQIFYVKTVERDDKKILPSGHRKNNFHFVTIIFKIKNLKIFSKDYIWMTRMTKLRKKVAKK